jgi:predicted NBD/HSP70 family sugar kinase
MDGSTISSTLRPSERYIVTALSGRDGGATRQELADLTGLPRTTLTATVASLIARGILSDSHEDPVGRRGPGRPSPTVRINLAGTTIAAVQLGRTQQSVTLVGLDGTIRADADIDLDLTRPLDAVAKELLTAARELSPTATRPAAMVVSVAMPFRKGVGAPPIPLDGRLGVPPVSTRYPRPDWLLSDPSTALSESIGIPAMVENDINLAILGEVGHGAARGARTAVYISVVPGFGAGTVVDGRLLRGTGGIAGELAHISIREDGHICLCGNRGCISTVRNNGPGMTDDLTTALGRRATLDDLISLAGQQDVIASRWLTDLGRVTGESLIGFIPMVGPDLLVVDSALGAAAHPVIAGLRETVERRTPAISRDGLDIRPGALGKGVIPVGAAVLAAQYHIEELGLGRQGLPCRPRGATHG